MIQHFRDREKEVENKLNKNKELRANQVLKYWNIIQIPTGTYTHMHIHTYIHTKALKCWGKKNQ